METVSFLFLRVIGQEGENNILQEASAIKDNVKSHLMEIQLDTNSEGSKHLEHADSEPWGKLKGNSSHDDPQNNVATTVHVQKNTDLEPKLQRFVFRLSVSLSVSE